MFIRGYGPPIDVATERHKIARTSLGVDAMTFEHLSDGRIQLTRSHSFHLPPEDLGQGFS